MADHEVTGGLANVDAVVAVSCMAHDPFVFFIESVHGPPAERDACLQFARMGGQAGVLPPPSRRDLLLVRPDAVPGREAQIEALVGMLSAVWDVLQHCDARE